MPNSKRAIFLLVLFAVACSTSPESLEEADLRPAVGTGGGGAAPPTPDASWKSERKRLAMLGLEYQIGEEEGRVVPAADEAREVLAGLGPADLDRLIAEGLAARAENRALDAIALTTRAVLLAPEDAERYLELGESLDGFLLEEQALAAYRTGLELSPKHVELTLRVGDAAWRRGSFDKAVSLFHRATELDPDSGEAWSQLARAHFFAGRDDACWRAMHRAEALGESVPPQLRAQLSARTPEPPH